MYVQRMYIKVVPKKLNKRIFYKFSSRLNHLNNLRNYAKINLILAKILNGFFLKQDLKNELMRVKYHASIWI